MRFNQILLEASYDSMLNAYKGILSDSTISNLMSYAKQLGRTDLSVWFLRYATYIALYIENQELSVKYLEKLARYVNTTPAALNNSPLLNPSTLSKQSVETLFQHLQHYMGLNIPAINNVRFDRQTVDEITAQFTEIEFQYKQTSAKFHKDSHDEKYEDIVLEFSDGLRWINLNRGECDAEAKAMRHCGNVGGGSRSERVLSLRLPVKQTTGPQAGQTLWKSVLTFVLDKDKYLTESKGYANEPPDAKYYPKIVALLRSNAVAGILGGGYAPENNFHLSDLARALANQLVKNKPLLGMETLLTGEMSLFDPDLQEELKIIYRKVPAVRYSLHLLTDTEFTQIARDFRAYLSSELVDSLTEYLYEQNADWYSGQVYDYQQSTGKLGTNDNIDWEDPHIPSYLELDENADELVSDMNYTVGEIDGDKIYRLASEFAADNFSPDGDNLDLLVGDVVNILSDYVSNEFDGRYKHSSISYYTNELIKSAFSRARIELVNGQYTLQVQITEQGKNNYWKAFNEI